VSEHSPKLPNPFAAGQEAHAKHKDVHTANPYRKFSREYTRWINGYQAAELAAIEARPLPEWAKEPEAA
jgi:hypothetical protein